MNLFEALRHLPKSLLTSLAFLSIGLLWFLDYSTGPEISLLIFYVVPIVLAVWLVGRRTAGLLAVTAALAWFLADLMTGREYAHPAIPYWNFAEKLLFFLLIVQLVATLKTALEREKLARQEFLEREIRIAEQVQERLLPRRSPAFETLECAGICRPVRSVGGDYFDFLPLAAGHVAIAVADVSGKGLSAALLMASLQATLRSFASMHGESASEVVAKANRQMCALTETNRFVTLFFGIYDEARRDLTCVNAGHNPPMLFRSGAGDTAPERLKPDGTVIGFFPESSWSQRTLGLAPGDLLIVFTDGVPEAANRHGEEFGERRLEAAVRRNLHRDAAGLCGAVLGEVAAFLEGAPAQDDLTVLAARGRPAPAPGSAREEKPWRTPTL